MLEILVMVIITPCAALLPASIVGFIANFILEEKFELQCRDDFVNEDLCFDSDYDYCEIVLTHNWRNTYGFIEGLASNILASWAIIRICGYLLVNADSNFSAQVKKNKSQ